MISESLESTEDPETALAAADINSDGELTQEELEALTVDQLRALAEELEITLTATKKADIIAEILAAQETTPEQQGNPEQQPGG